MERSQRLRLVESEIGALIARGRENGWLIVERRGAPESAVALYLAGGRLEVTVTVAPARRRAAATALGCLGFTPGERPGVFRRPDAGSEPRRLACLVELAMGAAQMPPDGYDVLVITREAAEGERLRMMAGRVEAGA